MASRKRTFAQTGFTPFTYKTKRGPRITARRTIPRVVPGVTRVSGYYGRYAGRSQELKFHDVDLDDAVIDNAGTVTATINIIPQDVTEKGRVGRKCVLRKLHWHYQLVLPEVVDAATPAPNDQVRVIVFQDKQCNGATATVTGILESADYQSFRNLANSGRFNVLLDRTHNINYRTLTSTQNADTFDHASVIQAYTYNKMCNIPLEFDSTTGAITEIRSNNIGVLLISQNGVAALNSKWRLRYSDGS